MEDYYYQVVSERYHTVQGTYKTKQRAQQVAVSMSERYQKNYYVKQVAFDE